MIITDYLKYQSTLSNDMDKNDVWSDFKALQANQDSGLGKVNTVTISVYVCLSDSGIHI